MQWWFGAFGFCKITFTHFFRSRIIFESTLQTEANLVDHRQFLNRKTFHSISTN